MAVADGVIAKPQQDAVEASVLASADHSTTETLPNEAGPCAQSEDNSKTSGKGRAKSKGKGRGKGKARSKTTRARKPVAVAKGETASGGDGEADPAADNQVKRKSSLKATVAAELAGRDVTEVVQEARAMVKECEEMIVQLEQTEQELEESMSDAKQAMEVSSKRVEAIGQREIEAVKQLKAARFEKLLAHSEVQEVVRAREEMVKRIMILEVELTSRQELADLEEAKKAAQEATDAAKQAFLEAKAKEKEAIEEMKQQLMGQRSQQLALLNAPDSGDGEDAPDAKHEDPVKELKKRAAAEMKEIEKMRQEREKKRQRMFAEAAGLSRGRPRSSKKALMPPTAEPAAESAEARTNDA